MTIASASALGAIIGKGIVLNDLLIFEPLLDFHGMPDIALRGLDYYLSCISYLSVCFATIIRGMRAEILFLNQSAIFIAGQNVHCFTLLITRPRCYSLRLCLISMFCWIKMSNLSLMTSMTSASVLMFLANSLHCWSRSH